MVRVLLPLLLGVCSSVEHRGFPDTAEAPCTGTLNGTRAVCVLEAPKGFLLRSLETLLVMMLSRIEALFDARKPTLTSSSRGAPTDEVLTEAGFEVLIEVLAGGTTFPMIFFLSAPAEGVIGGTGAPVVRGTAPGRLDWEVVEIGAVGLRVNIPKGRVRCSQGKIR